MHKRQKYFTVFHLAVVRAIKNYKALIGLTIFLITCLVIFAHLWKVAAARRGVIDLSADQLLWYIALNEWILIALPDVQEDIEQDLREGRLAYLLPRPISYLGSIFFEGLGTLCVHLLILGVVAFLFTWMRIGSFPFHPAGFVLVFVLGFLAGCVALLFQMIVGVSAFWVKEVTPFHWVWEKLLFVFGGMILPLSIYPGWMQTIAHFTPFPAILGERSALVFNFSAGAIFNVVGALLGWGAFGLICLLLLYRRGLRIVNVEGG